MCLSAVLWARLDGLYFANTKEQAAEAGFDDARFYEETSRPIGKRTLPTKRLAVPDAARALTLWANREDKKSY